MWLKTKYQYGYFNTDAVVAVEIIHGIPERAFFVMVRLYGEHSVCYAEFKYPSYRDCQNDAEFKAGRRAAFVKADECAAEFVIKYLDEGAKS